jgi:hypothetical protein
MISTYLINNYQRVLKHEFLSDNNLEIKYLTEHFEHFEKLSAVKMCRAGWTLPSPHVHLCSILELPHSK